MVSVLKGLNAASNSCGEQELEAALNSEHPEIDPSVFVERK